MITSWNPAAERDLRLHGRGGDRPAGLDPDPAHRAGEEREILDRILAGERVDHYETERVTQGRPAGVSLTVSPIRDDDGEVVGASVIARDITAGSARRARLAPPELTSALSREITPERASRSCSSRRSRRSGRGRRRRPARPLRRDDRARRQLRLHRGRHRGLGALPARRRGADDGAVRSASRSGRTRPRSCASRYPAAGEAQVRFASLAVIPLAVGARPFGAVSLSFERRATSTPRSAPSCSPPPSRPRRRSSARGSTSPSGWPTSGCVPGRGQRAALGLARPRRDAARARRARRPADRGLVRGRAGRRGRRAAQRRRRARRPATGPARRGAARALPGRPRRRTGVPNVIRTGEPELYPEIPDELLVEAARDEEHLRLMRELGLVSAMVVPLKARGRRARRDHLRRLRVGPPLRRRRPRARRGPRAPGRARDRQRDALPPRARGRGDPAARAAAAVAARDRGLEFAARYEPAAPGLEVGGDWYEVVALDDGTVGLTIGDVAGRGIHAASVMGRVRPALRAYVLDGHPPAEAMERLDRLMQGVRAARDDDGLPPPLRPGRPAASSTCAPATRRRWCACRTAGSRLAGGGTPPLGILDEFEFRTAPRRVPPAACCCSTPTA